MCVLVNNCYTDVRLVAINVTVEAIFIMLKFNVHKLSSVWIKYAVY